MLRSAGCYHNDRPERWALLEGLSIEALETTYTVGGNNGLRAGEILVTGGVTRSCTPPLFSYGGGAIGGLYMGDILGYLALLLVGALIVGVVMVFRRGRRMLGLKIAGLALAGLVVASIPFAMIDSAAVDAGFANETDRRAAERAGFTAPEAWREHRAAVAAEEAQREEQERLVREAAAAEEALLAEEEARRQAEQREREAAERAAREAAAAEEARLAEVAAAEAAAREAEECRADFTCWGRDRRIEAEIQCKRPIERQARYDHEWTDGWTEPMFSRFRWKDEEAGVMTYYGDRLRLQNGFGAWANVVYSCDFDTERNVALSVSVQAGRL